MIPNRVPTHRANQGAQENDRIPIPIERDFIHGSTNAGALGALRMNMINRMNNDLDNNLLSLRLFQANQDLLLAARHDQEQRLSFARPSFTPNPGFQDLAPQLFNQRNLFAGLHAMGLKSPMVPSQPETVLSEAYQRGKEDVLRSVLQGSNADSLNMSMMPLQRFRMPTDHVDVLAANQGPVDPSSNALEALGATSIERRKKNAPYFDASSLKDPDPDVVTSRRTRGGVTEPFPEKLHRVLQEVEENGKGDIVGFLPHGRAFAIHDPQRFCKDVMPNYFKQSRLSSFQRQLNLYGFTRITSGPDAGAYYHELFLKGRPALAIHMRRVGVASATSIQRSIRPTGHSPDFYSMAAVQGGPVGPKKRSTKADTKSSS